MATAMNTNTTTLRTVKSKGRYIDTQQIANGLGRTWTWVNKERFKGNFPPPSAKLGNTLLYAPSTVQRWARKNGLPFDLLSV